MSLVPYLMVLGIAQDGGHPQAGCERSCCAEAWERPAERHRVSALGIVDRMSKRYWILDATPDLPDQLHMLQRALPSGGLAGLMLTHAHIGHYTGLMYLGREAMGARGMPVWAMPRMRSFLADNGPWEMLSRLGYVEVEPLEDGRELRLGPALTITPIAVPHRDEYSETVGFIIRGPMNSALYLPDIDKWERWTTPIEEVLSNVGRAYVDGTFYGDGEIPGRSMAQIPHPFIEESLQRFGPLPPEERQKIRFIHLNHTNPALRAGSEAQTRISAAGMGVAVESEIFEL